MTEKRLRGVRHVFTDEQLRAYRRLTVTQRLEWLASAWQLTVDLLPEEKLAGYQKLREGKL